MRISQLPRKICVSLCTLAGLCGTQTLCLAALTECKVGREGQVTLVLPSPQITAKPYINTDPIRVWIASQKTTPAGWEYDLRYVPQEAGDFDLSSCLVSPESAAAIQPIQVRAETSLPDDTGKLFLATSHNPIRYVGYRVLSFVGLTIWLLGCLWLVLTRRKPIVQTPANQVVSAKPSDAERIRVLAAKAFNESLSNDDALELERLLRASQAGVRNSQARSDDQAITSVPDEASLETLLERWFYSPRGITQVEMEMVFERCRALT